MTHGSAWWHCISAAAAEEVKSENYTATNHLSMRVCVWALCCVRAEGKRLLCCLPLAASQWLWQGPRMHLHAQPSILKPMQLKVCTCTLGACMHAPNAIYVGGRAAIITPASTRHGATAAG